MTFKIGMKVVCVDDVWHPQHLRSLRRPVKGRVYTIREIDPCFGAGIAFRLVEIVNPEMTWDDDSRREVAFYASRFRPAVSPKQEVSFTTGAPLDSEQWDNRKRVEVVS